MRILHLSDFHFRPIWAADQRRVAKALLEDVRRMHTECAIDLVVFTGDLTFSGKDEEFELAEEVLLRPLAEALGIDVAEIVVVPGNHDIDRDDIDPYAEPGLREVLTNEDAVSSLLANDDLRNRHTARLDAYRRFRKRLFNVDAPLGYSTSREIGGLTVGIAALDSAWRATGAENHADKRHLIVGEHEARRLIDEVGSADVVIAAMHHTLDWLAPFDSDRIRSLLNQRTSVVLTGHSHTEDPTFVATTHGSALHGMGTCLFENIDYANGYSLIDLEANDRVRVTMRTWWAERDQFAEATNKTDGGIFEHGLVWNRSKLSNDPVGAVLARAQELGFTEVVRPIVEIVRETSVIDSVRERHDLDTVASLLVRPVFLERPFEEEVALVTQDEKKRVERVDVATMLEAHGRVLLSAGPEYGLTSSLAWLVEQHYQTNPTFLPVVLDYRKLPPGKDPLDKAVRDYLRTIGLIIGKDEPVPPCVIALDNLVDSKRRVQARVAEFASQHPEHRFIFGVKRAHQALWTQHLDTGDGVPVAYLGPFGRSEVKQLVALAAPGSPPALADRVLHLGSFESLPRSPFVMAALVAVVSNDAGSLDTATETRVLDAYVGLLLGRNEVLDTDAGMDFRNREAILAFLAEVYFNEGKDELTPVEVDKALADHYIRLGWPDSPARLVQLLVERRMLVVDGGAMRFRHPSLQYFFAAKRMRESREFADRVLEEPLRFPTTIRHHAGLDRNDQRLLEEIGAFVTALVEEPFKNLTGEIFDKVCGEAPIDKDSDVETLLERAALAPPPPPPTQTEEERDQFWEAVPEPSGDGDSAPEDAFTELLSSLTLLSHVLRCSELVEDSELKSQVLSDVLKYWGQLTTLILYVEDRQHPSRGDLRAAMGEVEDGGPSDEQLDAVAQVIIVAMTCAYAMTSLGSARLCGILDEALKKNVEDDPGSALMAAILAQYIGCDSWATIARRVMAKHQHNRLFDGIVRGFAEYSYNYAVLTPAQEREVEELISESMIRRSKYESAGVGPRNAAKSHVLSDLKAKRANAVRTRTLVESPSPLRIEAHDLVPALPAPGDVETVDGEIEAEIDE